MGKLMQWYSCLFTACLPLYIIRFHLGWYPSTLLEVLWLGFVGLTIGFYWTGLKKTVPLLRNPYIRTHLWNHIVATYRRQWLFWVIVLIFFVSTLLGVVMANNTKEALGIFRAYIIEPVLLCIAIVAVQRKVDIRPFVLLGATILFAWLFGLSLIQLLFHHWVFAPDELRLNRATGVFTTANALGLLLGPFGALFSGLALIETNVRKRLWYLLAVCLCAGTIILSQSLTALLALITAQMLVCLLFLFGQSKSRTLPFIKSYGAALLAIVIGSLVFFYVVLPRIAPTVYGPNLPSDSLAIRYYMWRGTIAMLSHHWLGVGFSSYPQAYAPYRIYPNDSLRHGFAIMPLYPHHMLLNFWSEIGFFGALSFFYLCYDFGKRALSARQTGWGLGLFGAVVYIIIHGLSDVPYFKNDLAMAFWLLYAFAFLLPSIVQYVTG